MNDVLAKAKQVKLLLFDVDGVLTDGHLLFSDNGQQYKAFYTRDGHGMKMLQNSGVDIGIITGRSSQAVVHRMQELGIKHIYQNCDDKVPVFENLVSLLGISYEQTAYVGDDIVDLPVMRKAGLSIAVLDAHPLVKQYAHWQTHNPGGRGAARDVCELIMQAQGTLDTQLKKYL